MLRMKGWHGGRVALSVLFFLAGWCCRLRSCAGAGFASCLSLESATLPHFRLCRLSLPPYLSLSPYLSLFPFISPYPLIFSYPPISPPLIFLSLTAWPCLLWSACASLCAVALVPALCAMRWTLPAAARACAVRWTLSGTSQRRTTARACAVDPVRPVSRRLAAALAAGRPTGNTQIYF